MKTPLSEIMSKAANVVDCTQAYEIAAAAQDGTSARYLAHLLETIHMLRWAIERDRPGMTRRFRDNETLESPCAGCGKTPQTCTCEVPHGA